MLAQDWIDISRVVVDLLKSVVPFGTLFLIFWVFKNEIKELIKNGGLKVTTPGLSLETLNKQSGKIGVKEKKKIEILNSELETSKEREQKLKELQEYTAREKDTFFLGYHFEKTYRLIFPSQMLIISSMKSFQDEMSDDLARSIYRRTIWATQFNTPYEQFIGFLIQTGFVVYDQQSNKLMLTPLGKTFLEYLQNNNIPLKLPANDLILCLKESKGWKVLYRFYR